MGGILEEIGMLGRGLMRGSKSGNVPRLLAREAESGLATRFAPPPATAPMAAPVAPSGIRAYHGSPHSFDRFSMDKIGTGEGAQAYGHGLYFAENEGVAKGYRDTLSKNQQLTWDGQPLTDRRDYWGTIDRLEQTDWRQARALEHFAKTNGTTEDRLRTMREYFHGQPDMLDAIDKVAKRATAKADGSMYEVNIKANSEHFLDWDKPLKDQPEQAQLAVWDKLEKTRTPTTPLTASLRNFWEERATGQDAVKLFGKDTSEFTKRGIPGIKYLDRGSRTPGVLLDGNPVTIAGAKSDAESIATFALSNEGSIAKALKYLADNPHPIHDEAAQLIKSGRMQFDPNRTRNYVVFDDSIIEIVKKYGIAGALGAGLITQEMADQMRAQGVPDAVSHKTSPAGPSAMPTRERFGG